MDPKVALLQHIAVFAAVVMIVIIIAVVIVSWYNYRLKKRIIDSGPIDHDALNFLKKLTDNGTEQLKWGCVLFMGGFGLVVNHLLPDIHGESAMPIGIEIMFIAAGFLIYYRIVRRRDKN